MRRCSLVAVVVLGALGLSVGALAQLSPQFDLNQFRPSELSTDGFALSHADGQGHLRFGVQVYIDFARNPLGLRVTGADNIPDSTLDLVYAQLTGHLMWSLGLWERLVIFMDLPYTFMLNEDLSQGERDFLQSIGQQQLIPNGRGLGDLYVGARGVLYGTRADIFQLAAQATLTTNTASAAWPEQTYLGEPNRPPNIGGWFELFGTLNAGDIIRIPLNVGFKTGFGQDVPSLSLGNQLTFGAGVQALLGQERFMLTFESFGRTAASRDTAFGGRQESPFELLGGFKYLDRRGLAIGFAGTGGVTRAYGSPSWRLIGMLGYTMPSKAEALPTDTDGDGIIDEDDGCPTEPEDFDRFEDADGCPDLDNDADGILDVDDACPDVPGPPEAYGCPETSRVVVEEGELRILEKIYFDFDSAKIQERSYPILNEVAAVLKAHPDLGVVRIEGHTCRLGPSDYNLRLSQRRADSVRRYLGNQGGVDLDRLTAQGFGESQPLIPDAKTEAELSQNRRVEFHFADEAEDPDTD